MCLITFACGAWFVGVDTRNQNQLVRNILLNGSEAADIITDGIFVVRGARSDDDEKTGICSGNDGADRSITLFF